MPAASRRRFSIALVFCIVALVVGACGSSAGSSASEARTTVQNFLHDIADGKATAACRLETDQTKALQVQAAALLSRYQQRPAGACGIEATFPSSDFAGSNHSPRARKVTVRGNEASVSMPSLSTGPFSNPLQAVDVRGKWLVNLTALLRVVATPADIERIEQTAEYSYACIGAWNRAVTITDEIQLPFLGQRPASQSIWADLLGDSSSGCSAMTISYPGIGYCETFTEEPRGGSWLSLPCARTENGNLLRNVWLLSDGTVEPASLPSPDGQVPALGTSSGASIASTGGKPVSIMCFNSAGAPSPKQAPSDCAIFGEPEADANLIILRNVHWSGWGQSEAHGVGTQEPNHVGAGEHSNPIAVTVSDPAPRCGGKLFYTTLTARVDGQTERLTLSGACTSEPGVS